MFVFHRQPARCSSLTLNPPFPRNNQLHVLKNALNASCFVSAWNISPPKIKLRSCKNDDSGRWYSVHGVLYSATRGQWLALTSVYLRSILTVLNNIAILIILAIKLSGEGPNCALDEAKHQLFKAWIKKNKDGKNQIVLKISRGKKNAGTTPKMLFENAVWR